MSNDNNTNTSVNDSIDSIDQNTTNIDDIDNDNIELINKYTELDSEIGNKCRFTEGYIRQDLYWCKDCYPTGYVGVCYGCLMNCHLHCDDVHQLYDKSYFRCDCGTKLCNLANINNASNNNNNTQQQIKPCTFDIEQTKINITNTDNRYSHNFTEHYCYCDTIHDNNKIYMSCRLCEDWFHSGPDDNCLSFINNTRTVPDNIDDTSYDLVCKLCLNKTEYNVLLPAFATYHYNYDNTESNSTTTTGISNDNNITCKRITSFPDNFDVDKMKRYDLLVDISKLCECDECTGLYKQLRIFLEGDKYVGITALMNTVEENSSDMLIETNADAIAASFNNDIIDNMMNSLDPSGKAYFAESVGRFKQLFVEEMNKYINNNNIEVVTADVVNEVFQRITQRHQQENISVQNDPTSYEYPE